MKTKRLKPCPFCGHTPEIVLTGSGKNLQFDTKTYKIMCSYCGCSLHDGRSCVVKLTYSPVNGAKADETELDKFIEDWNKRAELSKEIEE